MVGRLAQPGCHTNTGARSESGRSTVRIDGLLPENNRSLRKPMRGSVRKPKKEFSGRQSSCLQLSSKPVEYNFETVREGIQVARTTFDKLLAESPSRSPEQVFEQFKLSQPGCHTNTAARSGSGRSTMRLDEHLPENNRSLCKAMGGIVRNPKKKFSGRQSSCLQLSSKPVEYNFETVREGIQVARTTFDKLLAESPSRSPEQVFKQFKLQHPDLLINKSRSVEGHVPGVEVGDCFAYRVELRLVGLHRLRQAGIDSKKIHGSIPSPEGNIDKVAVSIVVSGSYEDDLDEGEKLTYTGEGGNDKGQYADQKMEGGNEALRNSYILGTLVRVIRGRPDPRRPSGTVFSYDGLYKVVNWSKELGKSKFEVFMFTLERESEQKPLIWSSPVICRFGLGSL